MPTLVGYPPSAIVNVVGSGNLDLGDQFRIDPDFDVDSSPYTFTITDADTQFQGDKDENESGDDSSQDVVITDQSGATIASGQVYLEDRHTFTDQFGDTVNIYRVEIGGTHYGWVADKSLTPGVTHEITGTSNVSDSDAPLYTDLEDPDFDPDDVNSVTGGALDDDIRTGADDDSIYAGGGDDVVAGGDGDDFISGGAGTDALTGGEGSDTIAGGAGGDVIDGGGGLDYLDYSGSDAAVNVNLEAGTATGGHADGDSFTGMDGILGSSYDDILIGFDAEGGSGGSYYTNIIYGNGGDDYIDGRDGTDYLYGGDGDDTILGGAGNDLVQGDAGSDILSGGSGADTLSGGQDDDTFLIEDDDGTSTITGGETGSDFDRIEFIEVSSGQGVTATFTGDESGSFSFDGSSASGTFTEIEAITGTDHSDTIDARLSGADLVLDGGTGDGVDTITGGSGDDVIYGDAAPGASTSITASNYSVTTNGYTVTAQNISGGALTSPSVANIGLHDGGFGADGTISDSDSLVSEQTGFDKASGLSETVIVDFDTDVQNLSFSFEHLYTANFGEVGHWEVFRDGVLISEADFTETSSGSGLGTIDLSAIGPIDRIVFTGILQTDGTDGSDFMLTDVTFDSIPSASGGGDDVLSGGAGDDTIYGQGGEDTITGGAGDDTLSGGDGDDIFVFQDGSGADTVTDFDLGDDDSDGFYNDQFDVTALTNATGDPVRARDVTVTDDGFGNALLTFPNGESVVMHGVTPGEISTPGQMYAAGIPCFTAGTRIQTENGETAIEDLRPGDRVLTADNGPQPIIWIGARHVAAPEMRANPKLCPVLIRKGILGATRDTILSQQHGVLVGMNDCDQSYLVRAHMLAEFGPGQVRLARGKRQVTYYHILFEAHQIIFANGLASESFYPGQFGLSALDRAAQREVFALFPELRSYRNTPEIYGASARVFMRRKEIKSMGFRPIQQRPIL